MKTRSALEPADASTHLSLGDHYPQIRRYLLRLTRDPAEADDLTQETFLRAHRHRDTLRDGRAVATWLYRIATHLYLDTVRRRTRRAPCHADAEVDLAGLVDSNTSSLDHAAERNEMSGCVQAHLEHLPDSYRTVLVLHDEHGLTAAEIAGLLGVSRGAVKIRLHRARRRLQTTLEDGCAFSHDDRGVLVCESKA